MTRILKWSAAILAGLLLALVIAAAVFYIFRFGLLRFGLLRFGIQPLMARGLRGPFLLSGFRYVPWIFLLGRLLIPLAFIALLILGGFAIGRGLRRPQVPVAVTPAAVAGAPVAPCQNCGRPVQADWNNCPYCGTRLRGDGPGASAGENIA